MVWVKEIFFAQFLRFFADVPSLTVGGVRNYVARLRAQQGRRVKQTTQCVVCSQSRQKLRLQSGSALGATCGNSEKRILGTTKKQQTKYADVPSLTVGGVRNYVARLRASR